EDRRRRELADADDGARASKAPRREALRAEADQGGQARALLRHVRRWKRQERRVPERGLQAQALRRVGDHARGLGRDPRPHGQDLTCYGATRPAATKAAWVTGIPSAKKCSIASAYRRISRWAASAARSETKFISERAL